MGKGKTAQRAARLAIADTKPKFITIKVMESYTKPSGAIGMRTRWEKVPKEEWNRKWGLK